MILKFINLSIFLSGFRLTLLVKNELELLRLRGVISRLSLARFAARSGATFRLRYGIVAPKRFSSFNSHGLTKMGFRFPSTMTARLTASLFGHLRWPIGFLVVLRSDSSTFGLAIRPPSVARVFGCSSQRYWALAPLPKLPSAIFLHVTHKIRIR